MLASIGLLIAVLISPLRTPDTHVLAYATNISRSGLLQATNKERAKAGVTTLSTDEQLNQAAQAKAQDMVMRNYWSHQTPEGNEPWVFITNSDYDYTKAGENLAFGFDTSTDTVKGWMTSETHRKNLLDKDYQEVGFGMANSKNFNQSGPATVIVAIYARPADQAGLLASTTQDGQTFGSSQNVSNANVMLRSAWASLSIGLLAIGLTAYLAFTHTKTVKRLFKKGEKLIIKHPVLDSVVISMLAVSILMLRTAGVIH
jgi:hypothetical protein